MGKNGKLKTGKDIVEALKRSDKDGVLNIRFDGKEYRVSRPPEAGNNWPLIRISPSKVSKAPEKFRKFRGTLGLNTINETRHQGPKPPGIVQFTLAHLKEQGGYSPDEALGVGDLMALYVSEYPPKLPHDHPPLTHKSPRNMGLLLASHENIEYNPSLIGIYWVKN